MNTAASHAAAWDAALGPALKEARCVNRLLVLEETASTQDAARELSNGTPGLLVAAVRQTAGRGRLGRTWDHGANLGVAATFVLDSRRNDSVTLSLAAGLAAMDACNGALGGARRLGLRWPNDVVERASNGGGRKIAGVLIERDQSCSLVGIGINVQQREADFPSGLTGRAASLGMLGASAHAVDVLSSLIRAMDLRLNENADRLAATWREADCLIGSTRSFVHDNRTYTGQVADIDPRSGIVLESSDGGRMTLPAATTSLVPLDEVS